MNETFDYIIVGAGSAGCALANRLSRESSRKVLLLEAGGKDRHPMIHIPLGFAFIMEDSKVNWCYKTEPEPNMNHRQLGWPRGKVLGGSSAINGMVYIRGQREDYNRWAEAGNSGWSYDELLPYFKRSEHNVRGADQYHGTGGPLWVDNIYDKFEMGELYVQAGVDSGLPYNEDFNGEEQEGVGYYQVNIKDGKRQSTAQTFLKQCEKRPNLKVQTNALTQRVLFEGKKANGVAYRVKGEDKIAHCRGEVILCGGTVNSPQLLELSGIGDSEWLQRFGIETLQHLPGVGENLQDHLTVNVQMTSQGVTTFYEESRPHHLLKNVYKLYAQKRGLLVHPAAQVGAFFKTGDEVERPDAQIHFTPAAGVKNARGHMETVPGNTATVCYLRPSSRGDVHIKSRDPESYPSIRANYLNTEEDRQKTVAAVEKTRQIFKAPAFEGVRTGELLPGPEVREYEEVLDFIRNTGESVYHPVGTCKMGQDENAVVDERLRVRGVEGLRVADASIMPEILSGNTNAAAVVIGEKCADMLIEDLY